MPEELDIVLPVHNEGETIAETLREFHRRGSAAAGRPLRLVVCEDGSTDGTVAALEALRGELPLLLVRSEERKGYPRAVLDGLRAARGEVVVVADSDGQCDPDDLGRLLAALEGADLAAGIRRPRADPLARRLMSAAFGLVHRALFGRALSDPSCPFVAVRRALLDRLLAGPFGVLPHGFWWEFAARAAAAGARLAETPVRHRPRASGGTRVFRPAAVPAIAAANLAGLARLARELDWPSAGRSFPVLALGAAVLFVFWPALGQPLMLDDLDLFYMNRVLPGVDPFLWLVALWKRCTFPFYFRPLSVPVFAGWHLLAGDSPAALRGAMLLLHLATAGALWSFARRATGDRVAAWFAAAFYALSWVHWDTLWNVVNAGQAVSELLLWLALGRLLGGAGGGAFLLATGAVLFKESAVLFALLGPAAEVLARGRAALSVRRLAAYAGWAAAYLGLRSFVLRGASATPPPGIEWWWPGAAALDLYGSAWELIVDPLRRPVPGGELACLLGARGAQAGEAFAWAAAVLALAALLAASARRAVARDADASARRAAGPAAFGALVFLAGLLPYLFLKTILDWGWAHRVTFSLSGAALVAGLAAAALVRRVAARRPAAGLAVAAALCAALVVSPALRVRGQDPALAPFDGVLLCRDAERSGRFFAESVLPSLRPGDRVAFSGAHPHLRLPQLLAGMTGRPPRPAAADGASEWVVTRTQTPDGVTLSARREGGPAASTSWTHPTRCDPPRRWDLSGLY
ncbi:MAG: glycosyltransferase family 2 protein [Elusimicrobiota bacterium]|nr:glycosyltransferase family 2 protein [Elusimicrobiota bacterium]